MAAVVAGSVTVAADASHSGSGLALALYEGKKAAREARWAAIGFSPTTTMRVDIMSALASEANEEAARVAPLVAAP